jgi:hypothetical protein
MSNYDNMTKKNMARAISVTIAKTKNQGIKFDQQEQIINDQ